jgi:hypothetical protein
MRSILDSVFEMSLRILLILDEMPESLSNDKIAIIDVYTLYGGTLGAAERNIHMENCFILDEYDARRELTKRAVKYLVIRNLIKISRDKSGIKYIITEQGRQFVSEVTSEYAKEYKTALFSVKRFIADKTEQELFRHMSRRVPL